MQIAVLIPCYNEQTTIEQVVRDFSVALPQAAIYVYDNNSTDNTAAVAERGGAIVRQEKLQGKGNVVCRMFADIEADVYVLVDGDDTYHAASTPRMIEKAIGERLDMVTGVRVALDRSAYPPGHQLGNRVLTGMVAQFFGNRCSDILSGFRVFSRRFVKSFPALVAGFDIEAALTIHALELHMPIGEMETPYKSRPVGSASKLHTVRDGFHVLLTILRLVEEERPLQSFAVLGLLLAVASITLAYPVIVTYLETGLVPRFPTAVLSASIMMLAVMSAAWGLIIDMITLGRREAKRLAYLAHSAPGTVETGAESSMKLWRAEPRR